GSGQPGHFGLGQAVIHGVEEGKRRNVALCEGGKGKPGTGHGLAFIKNVIELHGGVIGYEATPYGNNFYFILRR
ncbi:MAG: hypothetical protein M0Z75_16480, partial [Nitrospiraceae bacterium]|nr:hypothetical protein [Nitrospiraceae bacterium]